MIIESNIKEKLKIKLVQAKSIWIASAMISDSGWSFIQKQLSKNANQHYIIGIELSTSPSVFNHRNQSSNFSLRLAKETP